MAKDGFSPTWYLVAHTIGELKKVGYLGTIPTMRTETTMKSFRELISWELEQERKNGTSATLAATEEMADKIGASALRKLRYLSSRSAPKTSSGAAMGPAL